MEESLSILPRLWQLLLPQDCLLCGAPAGPGLLCGECLAELPRLGEPCPVCAEASPAGQICGACLKRAPAFDGSRAAFRYAFPTDKLVQALKYQHRLGVAAFFANAMLSAGRPEGDLILPLPLAARRLRERGFNQAVEIARPLAQATAIPLVLDACRRTRDTLSQATLPWQARRRNVRGAFECALDLTGMTVIVVDDVMTSGATLDEFAATLKARGAARVVNWVACRALRGNPPD